MVRGHYRNGSWVNPHERSGSFVIRWMKSIVIILPGFLADVATVIWKFVMVFFDLSITFVAGYYRTGCAVSSYEKTRIIAGRTLFVLIIIAILYIIY